MKRCASCSYSTPRWGVVCPCQICPYQDATTPEHYNMGDKCCVLPKYVCPRQLYDRGLKVVTL